MDHDKEPGDADRGNDHVDDEVVGSVPRSVQQNGDLPSWGRLIGGVAWLEGEGPVQVEVPLAETPG